MPELAAIFLIGSVVSLVFGFCITYLELSKYESQKFLILQKNLQKIDLRWNDLDGATEPFSEKSTEKELEKVKLTYLLISTVGVLLSWLGFLILIIIWISLKKLIVNKLEKKLFASDLVLVELDPVQVRYSMQNVTA